MEIVSLFAEPVDLREISDDDAQKLLDMLDAARDMETVTTNPRAVLGNYSVGVTIGRPGGFTAFRMGQGGELVAVTHTTYPNGTSVELDTLARMPNKRGLKLGAQALDYTLAQARSKGRKRMGLYTPPRNIPFYEAHGFRIDEALAAEGYCTKYTRMFRAL